MIESDRANAALELVRGLQQCFVHGLEQAASDHGADTSFEKAEWLRDAGAHGVGDRFFSMKNAFFNRASVNVSHIHYQDLPDKPLASATALSTIIHPENPHAPSVHIHISWTEMKNGKGYWRIMADLNPAISYDEDREDFENALRSASADLYSEAAAQGEKYFSIPALGRHRGVVHFYLEGFETGDFERDAKLALMTGQAAIDAYLDLLDRAMRERNQVSSSDRQDQLAYHTLYLFQVLTLDRGTTSGLLVHDQNDLGIMGSLPARIDKPLLASWQAMMEPPQDALLSALLEVLPDSGNVSDCARKALARAVRAHYQKHPEALQFQASGSVIPPTVKNHR